MSKSTQLPPGSWPWFAKVCRGIGLYFNEVVFRFTVHNRGNIPKSGAVVMVSNHSAMIDGPLLFALVRRPSVFLIKSEMFTGFMGWYLPRIGQLSIRRGESDRAPLLTAVRVLKDGGLVGVFPEGTRGEGDVASAHQGAAWLARTANAQILPVVCRGTRRPAGSGRRFRPRVDVLVGEPLPPPAGKGKVGLADATEDIRKTLVELVAELDELRSSR